LAHELCHLIVDDLQTYEVVGEQVLRSAGAEGRADDFAAHSLAPDAGIRQMASGPVDAVGAIRLAHGFGMSLTAMLNRLRDLKLISPTTAEEAQREGPRRLSMLAGLTDDYRSQEAKVGRFAPPGRLTELATAAYNKGEIGPGLLAAIVGEQQFESVKASWGVDEHDDLGYQSHLA
jgi:Zn-dependent peptidase ImmA (M78 family)